MPTLPERVTAEIEVYPQEVVREVSPELVGTNLTQLPTDRKQITVPATLARIREMGIKTVRFPNGCLADKYNWLDPPEDQMTVDEFLDFCESIGAEPYYTLNLQGGTEGLEGKPPADATLEERIRYRHTAPNPCGDTDYHYGMLPEALGLVRKYTLDRILAGKKPLTHFELGNENWGQARTDWPPEVYGATCEAYVRAILKLFLDAAEQEEKLSQVLLYFTMVGYPSTGNNQDPGQAVDRAVNVAWTAEVNRLAELGLIDAVQEHFYTYGHNTGDALIWTVHNLTNILALRHGLSNSRLDGHLDEELAYDLPLEWTEWNVKCWGTRPEDTRSLENGGFENGVDGWTIEFRPDRTGAAAVRAHAARRGSAGLELTAGPDAVALEARRVFSIENRQPPDSAGAGGASRKDRDPPALIGVGLWVKTDWPTNLRAVLRQANEGPSQGVILGQTVATQAGAWQRLVLAGAPKPDTTQCELVIRLAGSNVRAWVDEVRSIAWKTTAGAMPLTADRFEQQLHNVDALRVLLEWPTPRTHYHHLFGNYPCGTLSADGSERDNAAAFKLLGDRIGDRLVRTDVRTAVFDYRAPPGAGATDFNGVTPTTTGIPVLSATTTRRGDEVYTILVNRSTDRAVHARIALAGCTLKAEGDVRTLTGQDIDVPGANLESAPLVASHPIVRTVPPLSAQVIRVVLESVNEVPLVLSADRLNPSVRVGLEPDADRLTLSTTGAEPVRFAVAPDVDWLTVVPAVGLLTSQQPQTLAVTYQTARLAPGSYTATLLVLSPDAYNSPRRLPVELLVRPIRPDSDEDGDVDESDLVRFEACRGATPLAQAGPDCARARLDGDDDVDQNDYDLFETCFSGPNQRPDARCAE